MKKELFVQPETGETLERLSMNRHSLERLLGSDSDRTWLNKPHTTVALSWNRYLVSRNTSREINERMASHHSSVPIELVGAGCQEGLSARHNLPLFRYQPS